MKLDAVTKKSAILVSGTGMTYFFGLLYSVFAGRTLGPSDYADFVAATSLIFFLSAILGPVGHTVTRFTAIYAGRNEYGKVRSLSLFISKRVSICALILLLVGILFSKSLANILKYSSVTPLFLSYLVTFLALLTNVQRDVLRGVQSFHRYNVSIVLEAFIRLVFGTIVLSVICSVVSGLSAYLVASACALFITTYHTRKLLNKHQAESIDGSSVIRFTVPMYLLALNTAGFQNLDMFYVKHVFSALDAGNYGAAFALTKGIGLIAGPFGLLLLPLITELSERGKNAAKTTARLCGYFLLLILVPLLIFWLWPNEIMLIYGSEYQKASHLLLGLAGARVLGHLGILLAITLAAMKAFRFLFFSGSLLIGEAVAMLRFNRTLIEIITVVFVSHLLLFIGMAIIAISHMTVAKK